MKELLEFQILKIGDYILTPANLLMVVLILLITKFLGWIIRSVILKRFFEKKRVDIGRQFAISRFIKYFIYLISSLLILESVGIQPSVILASSAALLVGIGLGLQQTFNDLISGVILLVEANIEVGDVVKINDTIGTVKKIGLRTTDLETRNTTIKIIPNSKLINDNVINWNRNKTPTRFNIKVGVSYSSDIDLVTKLLLKATKENSDILNDPAPNVQFKDFGNSSLDFELFFFSYDYLKIEINKSNLRYKIMELFREHDVEIPFPQTDLWIKNPETLR